MGQAKNRGTFEQRKLAALEAQAEWKRAREEQEARRKLAEAARPTNQPHRQKQRAGMSRVMLAAAMATIIGSGLSAATSQPQHEKDA